MTSVNFIRCIGIFLMLAPEIAYAAITSDFGTRRDPFTGRAARHAGMDLRAGTGVPVYATGDGIVIRARRAGGYGNLVELDNGHGFQTRFGHLSRIDVAEGDVVRRGQRIGTVGSTGRSTGSHLHYEVRIDGRAVDPQRHARIIFADRPVFAPAPARVDFVAREYRAAGASVIRNFGSMTPVRADVAGTDPVIPGTQTGPSIRRW